MLVAVIFTPPSNLQARKPECPSWIHNLSGSMAAEAFQMPRQKVPAVCNRPPAKVYNSLLGVKASWGLMGKQQRG